MNKFFFLVLVVRVVSRVCRCDFRRFWSVMVGVKKERVWLIENRYFFYSSSRFKNIISGKLDFGRGILLG